MNSAEFNAETHVAAAKEWFANKKEEVSFIYTDTKLNLTGASSIYEFVIQQIEGWKKNEGGLPQDIYQQFINPYFNLKTQLQNFVLNNKDQGNEIYLDSVWASQITSSIQVLKSNTFTYDCPEVFFLKKIYNKDKTAIVGAIQYIMNAPVGNSPDNFRGAVMAYEFKLKGKSDITERRDLENVSLENLKTDFHQTLSDVKMKADDLIKETQKQIKENNTETYNSYIKYTEDFEAYKTNQENEVSDWLSKVKADFESFNTTSAKNVSDLAKTYEELLRLQKPADYWNKRATKLKGEGWKAMYWVIVLVMVACLTLYFLLWKTPEGMLLSFIKGDASAIKWSIVYITFISFLAFGIRAVAKVMFSSFHLSRDAEEREQLTYVYLALVKDKTIDEKDRTLIMQSLFSRADTGLLKEDSAPTMPGNIAEKLWSK